MDVRLTPETSYPNFTMMYLFARSFQLPMPHVLRGEAQLFAQPFMDIHGKTALFKEQPVFLL